jgi:Rrf2 family protein
MRLSQTAEYALRVLAYMATLPDNSPLRTRDIYEVTEIPPHYLSKIMRRLVTAGLLVSQKGHGGGFVFAKPLKEIRFLDILTAVDYEVEPNKCFFGWGECSGENPCPLHTFWSELKDNFVEWAETHTLKDVKK